VGLYGGYFGAGIGILMLAALSILGLQDIHEMNSLKVIFGGAVNGIAAAYFIWARMVYWPYVVLMAVAAILGGYLGAGTARRLGQQTVRRIVIAIGLGMALSLFIMSPVICRGPRSFEGFFSILSEHRASAKHDRPQKAMLRRVCPTLTLAAFLT
jgi:hypothetical protein